MVANKSFRDLTAPDLVKEWKRLVNQNIMMGRDSHMLKLRLAYMTPVQLLLGIQQYRGNKTITIPQFLQDEEIWYEPDEIAAEIELATFISNSFPTAYWIWHDCMDAETPDAFQAGFAARQELREWADRILG
jgi:hypothetical protein